MKTGVRIVVLVLTSICAAVGQTPTIVDGFSVRPGGPHPKYSAEEFRLLTIKRLMERPSPLQVGNAQLHRLGDQAAVDIMKILGGRSVSDAQIPTILDMLRKAYEVPKAILIAANRQPKASLFLLARTSHRGCYGLRNEAEEAGVLFSGGVGRVGDAL